MVSPITIAAVNPRAIKTMLVSYVLEMKPTRIASKKVKVPKRIMFVGEVLLADSKQAL